MATSPPGVIYLALPEDTDILMSDDDDLRYAAIDSVLQTNVAQDFAEQAQQVAQAYDQQQAQIQQMNNPVRVMKIG